MKLLRLVGLAFAAIWTEIAKGFGAAVLLGAFVLGWRGARLVWALLLAGAGAAFSLGVARLEDGKVDHALTNWYFLVLIYCALSLGGYLVGLAARATQQRRED